MYELTLIVSLMVGTNQDTAEFEVNRQFTTLEQCQQQGATLAEKLKQSDMETIQVQCDLD
ncbi:hypothetical protein [Vibrio gallicus]|uniref:hypothetical protein n=1 Tax=Vibrio gallicus TaxID=190897 RepID=UPI0021C316AE|nr:hypothetical protein [Vibrio gallicus]